MQRYGGFILLGLAVLLALFTSAWLYNWLEHQRTSLKSTEPQVVSLPTKMVAVATVDLSWGTTLTANMIKLVAFPSESLLEGYCSTVESVKGRVLTTSIKANEPILDAKLTPLDVKQGGMAVVTQPEKRAMAVRVDDVVGVAGFINPGNRVDVLVTLQQSPPQTKTVLQNVLVLAIGTQMEPPGNGTKPREATQMEPPGNGTKPREVRVITVEVTLEEAEKLALAAHEGKVTMALRNYANTQPILTSGATLSTLVNSYHLPTERVSGRTPPPALQAPPTRVEIIQGGKVHTLIFKEQ
jgi:pilus assembly protein CpaB